MSWSELEKYRNNALNPDWAGYDQKSKAIHDWRNYVTEKVRNIWDTIPIEGRLAIIDCCESAADAENWD